VTKKRPSPSDILNNSAKKEAGLIIFSAQSSEKISHQKIKRIFTQATRSIWGSVDRFVITRLGRCDAPDRGSFFFKWRPQYALFSGIGQWQRKVAKRRNNAASYECLWIRRSTHDYVI